jgi:anti-anti-sigma factor
LAYTDQRRCAVAEVVTPPSEIDPLSCGEFAASLRVPGTDDVVVDCEGITFIDSAGLVVLVDAKERLADSGRALVLRRPSRPLRKLLEITDLADLFPVEA